MGEEERYGRSGRRRCKLSRGYMKSLDGGSDVDCIDGGAILYMRLVLTISSLRQNVVTVVTLLLV